MKIIYIVKSFVLQVILLAFVCTAGSLHALAQTFVSSPMNQPNTIGEYYNNTGIVLSPGFSANGAIGVFHAFVQSTTLPVTPGFSGDQNYASTWVPRVKVSTIQQLKAIENNTSQVNISVKYLDGLGRTAQVVEKGSTPNGADLVQPYEYDELSRQVKTYLPYVSSNGGAGSFRTDANIGGQAAFYNSVNTNIAQSNTPYAKVLYENSPLDRVIENGAPGDYWQLSNSGISGSGHTTKTEYTGNNTTDISDVNNTRVAVLYTVNIDGNGLRSLISNNYYPANDLFVKVVRDENWSSSDGRSGTQEIYTSKEGKTVLKRSFVKNAAGSLDVLSTYLVYDDLGNLSFVLPPLSNPDILSASGGNSTTQDALNKLCYQYQYDEKQRLIAKKVPGKDWEYHVLNSLDQVVAAQDGNQRIRNEWMITKFDGVGRPVITGVWNNGGAATSRESLQGIVDQQTTLSESRTTSGNGYTSLSWPQNMTTYYKINYYDDYSIPGLPGGYVYQNYTGNPDGSSNQTQGFLTVVKTWPLSNPGTDLWSVYYYDDKGQIIQLQSTNHLSGKDITNSEYNFNGQLVKTIYQQSTAADAIVMTSRYVYDHHGRQLQSFKQINNDAEILLSQKEYNELGQLTDKKLHQKSSNPRFLQSIDYRYNIHGQLTSINDPSLISGSSLNSDDNSTSDVDKFGIAFKYDQAAVPQFNGNIGSVEWQTALPSGSTVQPVIGKYDFGYDKVNRLVKSVYSSDGNQNGYFDEYLSYDKAGNITTLGRYTEISSRRTQIDNLSYTYNGNQITEVDDNANNIYGFSDGLTGNIKQANEYGYDSNGNAVKDLNKGINLITYNNFGLPATIVWSDGKSLTYDYDGSGTKLRKSFNNGHSVVITDYLDGVQYEQNRISFVLTEEGIVRRNAGDNTYVYQYALKDQLGNTRVMIQPGYPDATTAAIIQISNYYPFGLQIASDNPGFSYTSGEKNNYLFNGKEEQDAIEMYDYGARFYDPAIGRWNVIDNLADEPEQVDKSPYTYVWNNPILRTDPDGNCPQCLIGAVVGAAINVGLHWEQILKNPSDVFAAAGIGAAAGALAGLTGGASLLTEGIGVSALSAIGNAVAIGAYSGATASLVQGFGNAVYFGDPYGFKEFATGAFYGGVTAGIFKSVELSINGGIVNPVGEAADPVMPIYQEDIDRVMAQGPTVTAPRTFTKSSLAFGREVHSEYKLAEHAPELGRFKEFNEIKGIRPDFVDFGTKTIYELKPYNPRSIQLGLKQLNNYQSIFEKQYGGVWKTILDHY